MDIVAKISAQAEKMTASRLQGMIWLMPELIMYSRPDCHLCDDAMELIQQACPGQAVQVTDIEHDLQLIMTYGERIPVLKRADGGQELGWPFDTQSLLEFLS